MSIVDWLFPASAPSIRDLIEARDVTRLLELLRQEGLEVRPRVADALGDVGDKRAVEPLIACLYDPQPGVNYSAAQALGRLGDPRAVEPLIGLLANESFLVRRTAVQALGRLRDPRAVTPLDGVMMRDERPELRRECAFALQVIGGPDADAALASDHGQAALAIDYCDKCGRALEPIGIPPEVRALLAYDHVVDIGTEAVPRAVKEDPFLFRAFMCRVCDMAFCPRCCAQEAAPSVISFDARGGTASRAPIIRCHRCGGMGLLPAYRPLIRRRLEIRNHLARTYGLSGDRAEASPSSQ
jgi:hypothetical protein